MTTKRKIAQDNPVALASLGAALVGGVAEAGTSVAKAATGPGSPLSADADDDGISLFVKWAEQNLSPDEMRRLGEALLSAADDADRGGGERQKTAMDSAWGRNRPDSFSRRFPGSRRIGRPL
jgi:hypothetical protein